MSTEAQRAKWRKGYYKSRSKDLAGHRLRGKLSSRKYRLTHKEKLLARRAVSVAIRAGSLTKKPCHCGSKKVQAHHNDYNAPLDVIWFCIRHHREYERR